MKTLTCDICKTQTFTGETEKEIMDQMWAHIEADHKEAADKMKAMPQAEQDAMMEKAKGMIKDM